MNCTEEEKRQRRPMRTLPTSSLALVIFTLLLVVGTGTGCGGVGALAFFAPPPSLHVSGSRGSRAVATRPLETTTMTRPQAKSRDGDDEDRSVSKTTPPSSSDWGTGATTTWTSSGRRNFLRRSFFAGAAASSVLLGATTTARPAWAKGEPITREAIASAFAAVRSELEDTSFTEMGKGGGVAFLEKCIDSGEWETIKTFTKFYDQELRKAKMGRARKLMTDGKMKGEAIQLSNAVTFDLIGINRASRVEDAPEARRYLGELREDLRKFLDYEGKMEVPSNT